MLGACLVEPQESNTYYDRILNPLKVKFKTIVGQENFARACHDEHVQRVIVDLLECFIGVAKGKKILTFLLEFTKKVGICRISNGFCRNIIQFHVSHIV